MQSHTGKALFAPMLLCFVQEMLYSLVHSYLGPPKRLQTQQPRSGSGFSVGSAGPMELPTCCPWETASAVHTDWAGSSSAAFKLLFLLDLSGREEAKQNLITAITLCFERCLKASATLSAFAIALGQKQ